MGEKMSQEIIAYSATIPADGRGTAAYRYTISKDHSSGYVTHQQNMENMGKAWGHYFDNIEAANKDFAKRILKG